MRECFYSNAWKCLLSAL